MTCILVVEDEQPLREEIMEWLGFEGYEVLGAGDGAEGIHLALHYQPDLIVCDIRMPKLDGHGVLLEVHAHPSTATIPFIYLTASATHEDIRLGMNLGADDYLTKPFSRAELLRAIHTRLEKKTRQEQDYRQRLTLLEHSLDEERQRRALKTQVIAMYSHDFRNPLASILSSCRLLRDYSDRMNDEQRLGHFNRIEFSTNLLMQMLEDMLTVGQMESGHFTFSPEWTNLDEFVPSLLEEFRYTFEMRTFHFNNALHRAAYVDKKLLRHILSNLLSNAIKYSPPEKPITTEIYASNGMIELAVEDQGIGIPPDDQTRLFEAFQRASNVGKIAGTGLGLTIVRQAVELHGGSIRLESRQGQGTRFIVTLAEPAAP